MIKLHQLDHNVAFPDVQYALDEPNGLLAFGGDLSVSRLLFAYQNGIFPWFSEGEPILWWSPDPRGVMPLEAFHCSKSLAKLVRQNKHQVTINHSFDQVIEQCASIPRHDEGTWITRSMINAYKQFHLAGHAHSVEVWQDKTLVGGLYGIAIGGVFCGESMFSQIPNASKLAFYYLVQHLKSLDADFIDCQMLNPHLAKLGCIEVDRAVFLNMLAKCKSKPISPSAWQAQTLNT